MIRFLKWCFWNLWYLPQPRGKRLGKWLLRTERTWWPWRKFRPSVWHNDDGRCWEVYLLDEQSHTVCKRVLMVDLHIGMDTGKVVGMDIYDCDICDAEKGMTPVMRHGNTTNIHAAAHPSVALDREIDARK